MVREGEGVRDVLLVVLAVLLAVSDVVALRVRVADLLPVSLADSVMLVV